MSASNYAEAKIADHMLGTTAWTMPTGVYIKLHLAGDPLEDGTGVPAVESTRKVVTFGAASVGTGIATSNLAAEWTSVSTTETYENFSLWDAVTGGNCLATGALTGAVAVTAGDNFTIASGDLTVTVS